MSSTEIKTLNAKDESPAFTLAQDGANAPKFREDDPIPDGFIAQLLVSLLVLFATFYVLARYFRAHLSKIFNHIHNRSDESYSIERIQLSPRTRLFIVKVEDRKIVIAESTTNVSVTTVKASLDLEPPQGK